MIHSIIGYDVILAILFLLFLHNSAFYLIFSHFVPITLDVGHDR